MTTAVLAALALMLYSLGYAAAVAVAVLIDKERVQPDIDDVQIGLALMLFIAWPMTLPMFAADYYKTSVRSAARKREQK